MEIRFGVGDSTWKSLTFKLWSNKQDVYAICREIPNEKTSLHQSGVTRFAEVSSSPRLPVHHSFLPILSDNRYCTVARFFITSDRIWEPSRAKIAGRSFAAVCSSSLDASKFTVGFTACDPRSVDVLDFKDNNILIHQLGPSKFVTLTHQSTNIGEILLGLRSERYGPSFYSRVIKSLRTNPFDPDFRDELIFYKSMLSTYTFWAHCNVPKQCDSEYSRVIEDALTETRDYEPFFVGG